MGDKMSDGKVIHLAAVNTTVETAGAAASHLVVAFLREWADAIEKGEKEADKAVLVLHYREPDEDAFIISSRRCNADMITTVGMLHLALADLANGGD